jgi:site-specific DNA recombinase
MTTKTKAIAYLRVSTDKQADKGLSLQAQKSKIDAYAALYELDIVEVVVDAGASAKTLAREGLQHALRELREGRAEALLVVKLDRLTRSVRDIGALIEEHFGPGKSALLSVSEHLDTRTPAGRLVINVLSSVHQWEREEASDRTKVALAEAKAQGKRLGRKPYALVAPETVKLVKELYASGRWSQRQLAEELNRRGIPTPGGGTWFISAVQRALIE